MNIIVFSVISVIRSLFFSFQLYADAAENWRLTTENYLVVLTGEDNSFLSIPTHIRHIILKKQP